ncbi:MAG TPA: purine-nucleoside phosphorylase [Myxococcota bacterium]|nr:purine-nucleoside phosphorylase [Myxococcota bacterium]
MTTKNPIVANALERLGASEFSMSAAPLADTLWAVKRLLGLTEWQSIDEVPSIAVVLGSGLGGFEERVDADFEVPYRDIGLPAPGILGHSGKLVIGSIGTRKVAVLAGRIHYYEGHSFEAVCRAVRMMALLGTRTLLLSNAAGGVNPDFRTGDLMLITDHINMMGDSPLRGPNPGNLGPRFPDMTDTWTPSIRESFTRQAEALGIDLRQGIYLANSGPAYETPAEVRMARVLGADAVGMSTVPEAVAARHAGMDVGGVSLITNMAAGMTHGRLSHEEVKAVGAASAARLGDLFKAVIESLQAPR